MTSRPTAPNPRDVLYETETSSGRVQITAAPESQDRYQAWLVWVDGAFWFEIGLAALTEISYVDRDVIYLRRPVRLHHHLELSMAESFKLVRALTGRRVELATDDHAWLCEVQQLLSALAAHLAARESEPKSFQRAYPALKEQREKEIAALHAALQKRGVSPEEARLYVKLGDAHVSREDGLGALSWGAPIRLLAELREHVRSILS